MILANKKKTHIYEIIYFLYFAVLFGAKSAGLYDGLLVFNIAVVISMVLFAIKVLMTEHTLFEYIIIGTLIGMCFATYFCSGEKGILYFVTLIFGIKNVNIQRIERLGVTLLAFFFPILTFLSVFSIIDDRFVYNQRARLFFKGAGIIRHYLGYPNPNVAHTTFIVLIALIILSRGYRGKKDLFLSSLCFFLVNTYIYYYDASQTGLLVFTFFQITVIYFNSKDKLGKLESGFITVLYPLIAFFIIIIPPLLNENTIEWLDQFLHRRVLFLNQRLTQTPWTMFGQRLQLSRLVEEAMDSNAYVYLLLQLGIVPCIVMTILMIFTIYKLVQDNRKTEIALAISFCILGLSDAFLYNSSFKNILFIFTGEYLYQWSEKLVKKLPPVFNTKIQVIKIGSLELDYSESVLYKCWKKVADLFDAVISRNVIRHILVFVVASVLISLIAYNVMDISVLDKDMQRYALEYAGGIGKHSWDEFQEEVLQLEFVRRSLSVGVWSAAVLVLVMTGIELSKLKGLKAELQK